MGLVLFCFKQKTAYERRISDWSSDVCSSDLVDVAGAERDVLDALALVLLEVFGDLRLVVGALVDRNADLAAGACHRLRLQPGQLALDVEVADLAEIEEELVEGRPLLHAHAVDGVGQVVDAGEAGARRTAGGASQRLEVCAVDRPGGAVAIEPGSEGSTEGREG